MQKKVILSLIIFVALSMIFSISVSAATAGVPEYVANMSGEEYFFANGAAITVEAVEGQPTQALVKWTEDGVEKSQVLGAGATTGSLTHIFGGMHNDDTEVNSSITINGGYVSWIHGGGLHRSNTATSTVVMNGGQVGMIKGGGADSWVTSCGCTEYAFTPGDYADAPCQVGTANVTINGGKISNINGSSVVYGGGNGHANTNVANVIINGGDLTEATVSGGGSHGNTSTVNLTINGTDEGKAIKVVQTVNRGTVNDVILEVKGGEIENLYVGGETAVDVNAIIKSSLQAEVAGTAEVSNMALGYNGGLEIDVTDPNSVIKAENIKVVVSNVENFDGVIADEVTPVYEVIIDGESYLIEEGKTIKDLPAYNTIIVKDGYTFKGFTKDGIAWDETVVITENIELVTVFEKIEESVGGNTNTSTEETPATNQTTTPEVKDTTPNTGATVSIVSVVAIIAIISFAGFAFVTKGKRTK